jgi:hypothetical protein
MEHPVLHWCSEDRNSVNCNEVNIETENYVLYNQSMYLEIAHAVIGTRL